MEQYTNAARLLLKGSTSLSPTAQLAGEVYDQLATSQDPEAEFLRHDASPFLYRGIPYYLGENTPADLIVDVGTGLGRQLKAITPYTINAVGFDPSLASIFMAMQVANILRTKRDPLKRGGFASFYQADMSNFVDEGVVWPDTADAVSAISVINHASHAMILDTYRQVRTALKPGGFFFFTMISKRNPQYNPAIMERIPGLPEDEETFLPNSGIDPKIPHHFSDAEEIIADMKECGFDVIEIEEDQTGAQIGGRSPGHFIVVARRPLPNDVVEVTTRYRENGRPGGNGHNRKVGVFSAAAGHVIALRADREENLPIVASA